MDSGLLTVLLGFRVVRQRVSDGGSRGECIRALGLSGENVGVCGVASSRSGPQTTGISDK